MNKKTKSNKSPKFGKSMKRKENGYRIERYKAYKHSNIGSINISGWFKLNQFQSKESVQRHLERRWSVISDKTLKGSDTRAYWISSINGLLDDNFHFCEFTVQFNLFGLSSDMDEGIWEILEEDMLETLNTPKIEFNSNM